MRALSGAIITAGAFIGLGLTALGYGLRFQGYHVENPETHQLYGIPTLLLILVVLVIGAVVGLGAAFMGLAYHHERRERERVNEKHLRSSTPLSAVR